MNDFSELPPAMVGISASITVTTHAGETDFSASISIQDRTSTGIRDALAAVGEQVQARYNETTQQATQQATGTDPAKFLWDALGVKLDRPDEEK